MNKDNQTGAPVNATEECPQCHYKKPHVHQPTEECPQCHYQPATKEPVKKDDDCAQCFYKK